MAHRQSGVGEFQLGDLGQRHQSTRGVSQLHELQRFGTQQKGGRQLQHHTVLVQGVVDHANLALSKGVGKSRVHIGHFEAQELELFSVNDERGLQTAFFKIGVDVFKLREFSKGTSDFGLPTPQVLQIVGLEGELVLSGGLPTTNANVLNRHQKKPGPSFLGKLDPEAGHHLIGCDGPL